MTQASVAASTLSSPFVPNPQHFNTSDAPTYANHPSPPPPDISLDDPGLALPADQPDYSVFATDIDGSTILTERYMHLSKTQKEYILSNHALGRITQAVAAARCGEQSAVRAHIPGHAAAASPTRCRQPFSPCCGRGGSRAGNWLRERNLEAICRTEQMGIELTLPESMAHDLIKRLATKLIKRLEVTDAVFCTVVDPNSCSTSLRVLTTDTTLLQWPVLKEWKKLAGPKAYATLHPAEEGIDIYRTLVWAFSGLEPALMLSGSLRAQLAQLFNRKRLAVTKGPGTFYHCLKGDALIEARAARQKAEQEYPELCPCGCGQKMTYIPPTQRVPEPTEQIERRYRYITWSAPPNSPWERLKHARGGARVITKGHVSNNSIGQVGGLTSYHAPPS